MNFVILLVSHKLITIIFEEGPNQAVHENKFLRVLQVLLFSWVTIEVRAIEDKVSPREFAIALFEVQMARFLIHLRSRSGRTAQFKAANFLGACNITLVIRGVEHVKS